MRRNEHQPIRIIPYTDALKEPIRVLNEEWLQKYFCIEPLDVVQLSDPAGQIIDRGGLIYYAEVNGQIVGTVTLMCVDVDTYKLAKMAVTEAFQGKGIGRCLLEHAIATAGERGVKKLILYSNTKLVAALELYKKYGFEMAPMDQAHFKRANIKMELLLPCQGGIAVTAASPGAGIKAADRPAGH